MAVLREPVVHFFAIAAAVLVLHGALGGEGDERTIVVDAERQAALRREFEERRGRAPTPAEETALVERWVEDEVLVRDALSLGLEEGDEIVRRRLIQKMQFLTRDLEPLPEPDEAALDAHLQRHAERWARPRRVSLRHVFVSREGGEPRPRAAALLDALRGGADPEALGDPFLSGREFRLRSESELAAVFGPGFARAALELPTDGWSEVESSYGLHLVRVLETAPGELPALEEVRGAVLRDWLAEQREAAERRAVERLRARYRVEVAAPGGGE